MRDRGVLTAWGGTRCHGCFLLLVFTLAVVSVARRGRLRGGHREHTGRSVRVAGFFAPSVPPMSPWCHHLVTSTWLCD
ncbi:hypothetical protein B005_1027 [Nocardiopsis alba ATCC BAA-2165]|uniref:Uncharacterized protein n=1 Tax=Nocardiopsis alba (strain ATCC BAA-2165 / BE74) TaxID=1205910 RepID=J7L6U5_NOCAA|nr:hypothetical protein B005_1027 [Nocardiopsis alba ATCC BAA-2165]